MPIRPRLFAFTAILIASTLAATPTPLCSPSPQQPEHLEAT